MRLTIRWSPICTVGSIEPLGITRACTRVPSMKRNAMITQNHEIISRQTRLPMVGCCAGFGGALGAGADVCATSELTVSLHFQLHELGRIIAGVARSAEFAFVIFHGFPQ